VVKGGVPTANEPAPRSDAPPAASGDPFARPNAASGPDPNELKPVAAPDANAAPDPNELKPVADQSAASNAPAPPPVQVNEIKQGAAGGEASADSTSSTASMASDQDVSSSKKKKKKGLKKILSF
jgi:hypothetical protein